MTTVEALKLLYIKLGGSYTDVSNVTTDAEMIDKIEDIAGPELPAIEEGDKGKVLKVDENGNLVFGTDEGTTLPTPADGDEGKVLKVDNELNYVLGDDEGTKLPAPVEGDEGKILKVDDELNYVYGDDKGTVYYTTTEDIEIGTYKNVSSTKIVYRKVISSVISVYGRIGNAPNYVAMSDEFGRTIINVYGVVTYDTNKTDMITGVIDDTTQNYLLVVLPEAADTWLTSDTNNKANLMLFIEYLDLGD